MIIDQRPQKRKLAKIKSRLNSVKNVAKIKSKGSATGENGSRNHASVHMQQRTKVCA